LSQEASCWREGLQVARGTTALPGVVRFADSYASSDVQHERFSSSPHVSSANNLDRARRSCWIGSSVAVFPAIGSLAGRRGLCGSDSRRVEAALSGWCAASEKSQTIRRMWEFALCVRVVAGGHAASWGCLSPLRGLRARPFIRPRSRPLSHPTRKRAQRRLHGMRTGLTSLSEEGVNRSSSLTGERA
jgi:hypothetical protein